ncbi:hypothetical protein LTR16_004892, partial [Cryomyces antarcticus]
MSTTPTTSAGSTPRNPDVGIATDDRGAELILNRNIDFPKCEKPYFRRDICKSQM